jgi:hypothetical protein
MERLANPGPVGLMGFGMTTILLNLHNIGLFPIDSIVLAMGIFYGGLAQIIAGLFEYKRGNTFAFTAFVSYGTFWLTLVFIILAPMFTDNILPANGVYLGVYLLLWGIFTTFLFIGTFRANRVLQLIFFTLAILFFLLAFEHLFHIKILGLIAGYEGVICGSLAFYLAMAEVLNEQFGKIILPIGGEIKLLSN